MTLSNVHRIPLKLERSFDMVNESRLKQNYEKKNHIVPQTGLSLYVLCAKFQNF